MVAVPSFVSANARRGLSLLEYAGDGLRPATVREARQMSAGSISPDKVRRMAAWLARHEVDLGSEDAQAYVAGTRDRPTPGQVAWLLWGGDLASGQRDRAKRWADRKVQQLINDGELEKATAAQIKVGSSVQYAVPKPPGPTEFATGIVESISRSGDVKIGTEVLTATSDDPVAQVRVYVKTDAGYDKTDRIVPKNVSDLRVIASIDDEIDKAVSGDVRSTLSEKVQTHNDQVGSQDGKRVSLSMLTQVYERGIGAYRSNPASVRPSVTSAEQWAYARVNAFLTAVRSGRFPRSSFDTDLLPDGHPLATSQRLKETDNMASTDKGYGYEMKDDDEYEYDPLTSLLDAYNTSVRMGPVTQDLTVKIMALINKVRSMYMTEDSMGDTMKNGNGYKNPITCLVHAYLGLLMTDRADLRRDVMALIHEAEQMLYPADRETGDQTDMVDGEGRGDVESADGNNDGRRLVQRVIRQEGDQWCVSSETGRSFGCYRNQQDAEDRLAQIERFSSTRLVQATASDLIHWHDQCHKADDVSDGLRLAHDLIEDELESRGHAQPYDLTLDDKIDLIAGNTSGVLSKSIERRYTLGPWYVPDTEDAHGEFTDPDTLQQALWDWVRKGDRSIYLQHGDKVAGEMVEILTLPFPIDADLTVPEQGTTRYTFPADTPFMGVVWEPWAWELVKSGRLRGYSIGGSARRMSADLPDTATV